MKFRRARSLRSLVCIAVLASGAVAVGATPASAACASNPGTNPITVRPDPPLPDPGIVVPGIPRGIVTVCASVEGDPNPAVDTNPTVEVQPFGCGVPCFVVEWDGVTIQGVTVSGSVDDSLAFQLPIPGGNYGGFCIDSGMACPE